MAKFADDVMPFLLKAVPFPLAVTWHVQYVFGINVTLPYLPRGTVLRNSLNAASFFHS